MCRAGESTLVLLFVLASAGAQPGVKPDSPPEQFEAFTKEFHAAGHQLFNATTDEQRDKIAAQVDGLSLRVLEFARKHAKDPIALDALVQVVVQELWLQNNTLHPGRERVHPEAEAIEQLLRDHVRSERLGFVCHRVSFGFGKECERFLRSVMAMNPHKDVQALACLYLGQFLNTRGQRLDLVRERPELARRYRKLFGKDYLESLLRQDRTKTDEVEDLFERATRQYGNVKLYGKRTVADQAALDLHEIRHRHAK